MPPKCEWLPSEPKNTVVETWCKILQQQNKHTRNIPCVQSLVCNHIDSVEIFPWLQEECDRKKVSIRYVVLEDFRRLIMIITDEFVGHQHGRDPPTGREIHRDGR